MMFLYLALICALSPRLCFLSPGKIGEALAGLHVLAAHFVILCSKKIACELRICKVNSA